MKEIIIIIGSKAKGIQIWMKRAFHSSAERIEWDTWNMIWWVMTCIIGNLWENDIQKKNCVLKWVPLSFCVRILAILFLWIFWSELYFCMLHACLPAVTSHHCCVCCQPTRETIKSIRSARRPDFLSRGISILVCSWLRATKITILVHQRNIQKIWRKFSSHFHMQNFWAISTKYSVTAAAYLCPSFLTSITSTLSIQDTKPLMDVVLYAIDDRCSTDFLSDTCLI